jgi:hypothetical protein
MQIFTLKKLFFFRDKKNELKVSQEAIIVTHCYTAHAEFIKSVEAGQFFG